ncbi:MAG: lytic transglycosylase domain-containing protein [Sulfuricellaceae bacterium]|nr:lytic transglycosylase domain-containing protein [Sulfuricellaceae bacterium]
MSRWFFILALALAECLLVLPVAAEPKRSPPAVENEYPRLRALLEQGWSAEVGHGQFRNVPLATALYCEAGRLGSVEGYYRAGLIYFSKNAFFHNMDTAARFFSIASQLGHRDAGKLLEITGPPGDMPLPCMSIEEAGGFDLDHYVRELPNHKRHVVDLIRKLAPRYSVDTKLALAVASVESNFNVFARSPKNAQGVMQLIPETAARFNVRNPYNPEQNIRGGLAYLRWLGIYFEGDMVRVIAAYNAGEGAVLRYGGIPPYDETQAYVMRVLQYSGKGLNQALPGKRRPPRGT